MRNIWPYIFFNIFSPQKLALLWLFCLRNGQRTNVPPSPIGGDSRTAGAARAAP